MSTMDWLFKPRPPRARKCCDYCNTRSFGLGVRGNCQNTFCGPWCEAWYVNCIYHRKPELPTLKPPDDLVLYP